MHRIHFVVQETAKTAYRDEARREGKSLGQWLREAADEKLAEAGPRKFTVQHLRAFNDACDTRRADGREPDWPEAKRVIGDSRRTGIQDE